MTTLSKQTARALLRVVQSSDEGFTASKTLLQFSADYGIGRNKGVRLLFDAEDKAHVRELLRAEGIDPATAPAAWDPLTRAQALELGPDEKFA
ncbi:hypothetical protein U5801_29700, partial [Lamprobacter modestohalophilus]|uniref:hypothetical protein n=1 Tax=Lamprobacter modestohalophilus TaxID=1064514 RepID=UPI002ADED17E